MMSSSAAFSQVDKATTPTSVDPLDEAINELFGCEQPQEIEDVNMIHLILSEPDFGEPALHPQSPVPVPVPVTVPSPSPTMQTRPAMVSVGSMSSMRRTVASAVSMSSLPSSSNITSSRSASSKTKRSSDKPKRALSAYNIYFTVERKKLTAAQAKEGSPKLSFKEIACKIAGMWKKISQEEKMEYECLAAHDTERYEKAMVEWKASQQSLESSLQQQQQRSHSHQNHGNTSWSQANMQYLRTSQNNIFF